MMGKDTEARAEAAELLRIMPEWSIEGWKQRQADAYKNQADVNHLAEGWRRAGRFSSIKTTNLKAYEKYLKGVEHFHRTTDADDFEARRLPEHSFRKPID